MALIKYSIGNITTIEDKDSIEKIEEQELPTGKIIVCNKCEIQHMLMSDKSNIKCSCGNIVELN